ncbi:radical SAM protein [Anaerocolumna sp. AGMB13025]|uniref:radical SAM protein n=1 Tax=Anaerocolumna sp. AGMB13025 TaxID=3039116 RepID=UPI00241F97DB|nr:radical SAM protein [Anaerocolumna sp. AGMB13025]WFR56403.1 radical SAM protein [Anaerocolumna sp. AGMB13025]
MKIGLIDVDSKIPNLALMKISSFYKSLGEQVEFVRDNVKYEKIYASAIFTRSKDECEKLIAMYGDKIEIGGTGWSLQKELPEEIEKMKPDYDLYSIEEIASRMKGIGTKGHKYKKAAEIVNAGIGFTSRGCIRNCGFCFVPKKEGLFRSVAEIKDLINPKSKVLILHDNNLTADPYCIDKLHEIRDRGLIVDINQGCDVRLVNDDIAKALSEVKHLRSIHYAWDLMGYENQVMDGIKTLSKYIKPYRHMCFMLVGFNTSFDEDMYRFKKLVEMKVDPFVMIYNQLPDTKLKHFARWVNSRIYKKCRFEEYGPWIKEQNGQLELKLFR